MTLQIFNPADAELPVACTAQDKQVAERLIADCLAEIKNSDKPSEEAAMAAIGAPRARARALLELLQFQRNQKFELKDCSSGKAILDAPPAQQSEIVLIAMNSQVKEFYNDLLADRLHRQILKSLLRRKLPYDDAAIVRMLTLVFADSVIECTLPLSSIMSIVERHVKQQGVSKSVRRHLKKLSETYHPEAGLATERKVGVRIRALLDGADEKPNVRLVSQEEKANAAPPPGLESELNTGEAWTGRLLAELESLPADDRRQWHLLLQHCGTARSSKPSKKWLNQASQLVGPIGQTGFVRILSPVLAEIGQPGESQKFNHGGYVHFGEATQIHDTHADRLRGLVWVTALFDDADLIGIVGDAAEKCFQKIRDVGPRSPKVGNACLISLASLASESAVAQLGRLKSRAKHVSTRKQIERAFDRASKTAGLSRADLVELGVPTFGMTDCGSLMQPIGDFTAAVTVRSDRKADLCWVKPDGKIQKTVPVAVKSDHGESLKALKKKLKDIDKLMPSLRDRVEQLFLTERRWSMADFRKRFLHHPLVGVVARRIIWNLDLNETTIAAVWQDGQWIAENGRNVEAVDDQTNVTIWHPMQATAESVLQWRQWLTDNQVSQPFKQAHREIYVLTDAERDTRIYSNRFAAHIIRQHQFAALCHQRGWRFELQGDWDSWNAPTLKIPQFNLQVEFIVEPMDGLNEVTQSFIYTHLTTDQVRFSRLDSSEPAIPGLPITLEEIPALVFSEVMRDVDLFVGVTSIGNDPNWQERGDDGPHTDYWQQFSFGDLQESAVTRKQTLEEIVPRLTIADQCTFDDRFLIVRGKLRSYKIHLGSGNILMSPNDQYLCIVQKRGLGASRTNDIFLPFEGDNTLSLILSKAFMLAHDDKIKDQTIVNQIRLDRV